MSSYVVMSKPNHNDIMNEQDLSCLKLSKWFMFFTNTHTTSYRSMDSHRKPVGECICGENNGRGATDVCEEVSEDDEDSKTVVVVFVVANAVLCQLRRRPAFQCKPHLLRGGVIELAFEEV